MFLKVYPKYVMEVSAPRIVDEEGTVPHVKNIKNNESYMKLFFLFNEITTNLRKISRLKFIDIEDKIFFIFEKGGKKRKRMEIRFF